ncbi:MAG: acyclic terpene utilization AtuA family protein, partial [Alphaproteobacteria bacterium]
GPDRVAVSGARGRPPTPYYKVCGQEQDGYRTQFTIMIGGRDAAAKARRVGESITERGRLLFRGLNMGDFRDVSIEVLGAESTYGPHAKAQDSREVVLKLTVHHDRREALEVFAREFPSIGLGMAQGITGGGGGRVRASPFIRLHSFLVPREMARPEVRLEGADVAQRAVPGSLYRELEPLPAETGDWPQAETPTVPLPLLAIAYARSGDKGDISNIGVAARHPDFEPLIGRQVTAEKVKDWFAHLASGPVTRYRLPGLNAFNFVLEAALGGGGTASLRFDPQGKAHGQMLLEMPVEVPERFLDHPALKRVRETPA